MTDWADIASAPRDGTRFVGWDWKHGRVLASQRMIGSTLHTETWAIDPCGILEPPEPYLWAEYRGRDDLPALPTDKKGDV